MTFSLTWLADVLRLSNLSVTEVGDWKSRGRADMGTVRGVLCHHTGGAASGDHPSLDTVLNGRPGLAGPLSHLLLARSGTFFVLAAGRCNHAGDGSWQGVTAGNSSFIGIEAENVGNGRDPWPEVQLDAYARGVAAILTHIRAPAIMCCGHKEYAFPRGRKIDPSFDMGTFRTRVSLEMGQLPVAGSISIPSEHPHVGMLKRGDHGEDVRQLQLLLRVATDGIFGPGTEAAVKAFQTSHGLTADGLVGPATWAALGV